MAEIVRLDRYTVSIDGQTVRMTEDQESRVRQMTDEQVERFVTVMTGGVR